VRDGSGRLSLPIHHLTHTPGTPGAYVFHSCPTAATMHPTIEQIWQHHQLGVGTEGGGVSIADQRGVTPGFLDALVILSVERARLRERRLADLPGGR